MASTFALDITRDLQVVVKPQSRNAIQLCCCAGERCDEGCFFQRISRFFERRPAASADVHRTGNQGAGKK